MARLPAEFKLGLFQRICDAVEEGTFPTVLQAIKTMQKDGFASVSGGNTVISASGGGFSTTFQIPGAYSPQELFSFWTELRSIYQNAKDYLISAGTAEPTDEQIRVQMGYSDCFEAITVVRDDFTLINMPGGFA